METGALLLAAVGLVLVFEGLGYAAAPDFMKKMAARISQMGRDDVQRAGLVAATIGVVVVYAVVRLS